VKLAWTRTNGKYRSEMCDSTEVVVWQEYRGYWVQTWDGDRIKRIDRTLTGAKWYAQQAEDRTQDKMDEVDA
jgi:hypothetical protein